MKPIAEQSYYEILEIPPDAPVEEVEMAYQRAKALYGPGSLATYSLVAPEEMALLNRRIEEARQVLLDAGTRAGYDATLPNSGRAVAPRPTAPPPAEGAAELASAAAPAQPAAPAEAAPAAEGAPGPGAAAEATASPPEAAAPPRDSPARVASPGPATPPRVASPGPASLPQPEPQAAPAAPVAAPPPAVPGAKPAGFSAPEGAAWTGEMLRQAREGRGLTLHQLAERTKVARHHLENIEADRYRLLPAPVYLRGILISLAKELRLDPQKVSRSYLEGVRAAEAQAAPPKPR